MCRLVSGTIDNGIVTTIACKVLLVENFLTQCVHRSASLLLHVCGSLINKIPFVGVILL